MFFVTYIRQTVCLAKNLLVGKQEGEILIRIFLALPFL